MFTTNLFNNCNRFALLQKMLIFDGIFDGALIEYFFRNYLDLVYFQDKYFLFLFLRCPFSLLKLLIDCGLNVYRLMAA